MNTWADGMLAEDTIDRVTSAVVAALHLDLTSSGWSDIILDVCGEPRLAARSVGASPTSGWGADC